MVEQIKSLFVIDETVETRLRQFPLLAELLLSTESMDAIEKQYWLEILPRMTDAQVSRLVDILETERAKLVELEEKYRLEIAAFNENNLPEWEGDSSA